MSQETGAVVHWRIVVQAPIERAFTVFIERFGGFKPPEHNLLRSPITEAAFGSRVGGHIYVRAVDGSECRWACILAYEPPDRVVFIWGISPRRRRPGEHLSLCAWSSVARDRWWPGRHRLRSS